MSEQEFIKLKQWSETLHSIQQEYSCYNNIETVTKWVDVRLDFYNKKQNK